VTVAILCTRTQYALRPMPELEAARFPPILTTAMAAELLHVHVEYLRRMVREGRIPAHRFPGGREIRFHRDELIQWVKDQPGYNRSPSAEDRVATD
jgi:excisionase family DNA binding protein